MHFSPWLYVFVVCSICKRKKKKDICPGGAFDPFCSLWVGTLMGYSCICYFLCVLLIFI